MKAIILVLSLIFLLPVLSTEKSPIAGKIIKTKHETEGTNYFVVFTQNKKKYAYPVSPRSTIKNMQNFEGKLVQIFGETELKKSNRDESRYIMFFNLTKLRIITVSDLGVTKSMKESNEVTDYLEKQKIKLIESNTANKMDKPTRGISDKAANTAIFVGGAILAAEILGAVAQ